MFESLFAPLNSFDETHFDELFREFLGGVVNRLRVRIPSSSLQLLEEACGTLDFFRDPALAWCPEMGYLNQMLADAKRAETAVAQFLLCAVAAGRSFAVTTAARPGDSIYFNGYQLQCGECIRMEFQGDHLRVETEEQETEFERQHNVWVKCSWAGPDPMRRASNNILLTAGAYLDPALRIPLDTDLSAEAFDEAVRTTEWALQLIEEAAPSYLTWCKRVLKQVQLVGCSTPGVSTSRSALIRPGVISTSHPAHVVQFAESIVHECSHQYFYLLEALRPIKRTPDDLGLFYSSILARERPLDKILCAYHATANIIFFLRLLQQRCPEFAERAELHMTEHRCVGEQLLGVLVANTGKLSDEAIEFWSPSRKLVLSAVRGQPFNDEL